MLQSERNIVYAVFCKGRTMNASWQLWWQKNVNEIENEDTVYK